MAEADQIDPGQATRVQIPFGMLPKGVQMQAASQFDPATVKALREARDKSDGRYLILIYRADPPDAAGKTTVRQHRCTGQNWDAGWWMLAYQCFMSAMLAINPAWLALGPQEPEAEPSPAEIPPEANVGDGL